jgi:hypothetical protein
MARSLGGDPPIELPPEPKPEPLPEPKPQEVKEPEPEEDPAARHQRISREIALRLVRENVDLREQLIWERHMRAQLEVELARRSQQLAAQQAPIPLVMPSDAQRQLLGAQVQFGFCTCVPGRADALRGPQPHRIVG